MIDHVSIAVSNLAASTAFYEQVLQPLGLGLMVQRVHTVGFGKRHPEFWLNRRPEMNPVGENTGNHICLRAPSTDAVSLFHERALLLGGRCDGPPTHRQGELTAYFSGFIRDLDGNKIEAVTFPRG